MTNVSLTEMKQHSPATAGMTWLVKKKLRCVGKVWDFGEPECKGENVPALLNKRYPLRNIFASMTDDRLN